MLTLRSLAANDASAVRCIYSGAAVTYLGRSEMTLPEAEQYVLQVAEWAASEPAQQYILGVDVVGDLVGVVKLGRRPQGHGRVSYILREDVWGLGYATAAVLLLADFAAAAGFASLGAKHHPGNPASGRVLAKAGFTGIGAQNDMIEYHRDLS
ncbi:GNAT family N-acetyltransferase [Streptomyces sp. NPDC090077]|uniref:GNAT family N-acetyltransferase n=1 Tax=Streptomyces sp. NPDC090077 TaxID=3365938 RepID=UPI0038166EF3